MLSGVHLSSPSSSSPLTPAPPEMSVPEIIWLYTWSSAPRVGTQAFVLLLLSLCGGPQAYFFPLVHCDYFLLLPLSLEGRENLLGDEYLEIFFFLLPCLHPTAPKRCG